MSRPNQPRSLATTRGATNASIRNRKLGERGPSGEADAHAAPSQRAWRECVLAGICPICHAGPFIVLAMHTRKKHAIDKRELRERAGFFYGDSICDPAHHERCSEVAKERGISENRRFMRPNKGKLRPRKLTPAAREQNRRKLATYADEIGPAAAREQRRAAGRVNARNRVLLRTCRGPGCCNLMLGTQIPNCSERCVRRSLALKGFASRTPEAREAKIAQLERDDP